MRERTVDERVWDLAIVGGGLAGLTAAAIAAREGRSVLLLEQGRKIGGRAATTAREGASFNMGPHALYCEGEAFRTFRELGVPFSGRFPNSGRGLLLADGKGFDLPRGLGALLRSRLFSFREKLQLTRLTQRLGRIDPRTLDSIAVSDWVESIAGTSRVAGLLHSFLRLATFVNDPHEQSAGAALEQYRLGQRGNVWYLDHGWQTLVDGLAEVARSAGAEILPGASATAVSVETPLVRIDVKGREPVQAQAVIIAATPQETGDLLQLPDDHPLARRIASVRPARAACLDIALSRLPRPNERFAIGLDEPYYFSVHSAAAKLAPEGVAVIQAMKYLGSDGPADADAVETELESLLDAVQPGWSNFLITRRFLPNMFVATDMPRASFGGNAGRVAPTAAHLPGVFLAGDWIGPTGQLADASVASARAAAAAAIDHAKATPQASRLSMT